MLTRETLEALQKLVGHLGGEIDRLTVCRSHVEDLLQSYGAPLTTSDSSSSHERPKHEARKPAPKPERREVPTAPGGRRRGKLSDDDRAAIVRDYIPGTRGVKRAA